MPLAADTAVTESEVGDLVAGAAASEGKGGGVEPTEADGGGGGGGVEPTEADSGCETAGSADIVAGGDQRCPVGSCTGSITCNSGGSFSSSGVGLISMTVGTMVM